MTHAVAHELIGLEHSLIEAVQRHDTDQLEQLLAAEFTLQGAAGQLDREAFLEAAAGAYVIAEFAYEEIDPEIYGNMAVVVSRYFQRGSFEGRDVTHQMHVTDIWVRRDGRWQITRRHATLAG